MITTIEAKELFNRPIIRLLNKKIQNALKNGSEKIFWYTDSKIISDIITTNLKDGGWQFTKTNIEEDIIIRILVKKSLSK